MEIPVPLVAGIGTAIGALIAIILAIGKLAQKLGKIDQLVKDSGRAQGRLPQNTLRYQRPQRPNQRQGGRPHDDDESRARHAQPPALDCRSHRRSIPPAPADTLAGAPLGPLGRRPADQPAGGVATAGATPITCATLRPVSLGVLSPLPEFGQVPMAA